MSSIIIFFCHRIRSNTATLLREDFQGMKIRMHLTNIEGSGERKALVIDGLHVFQNGASDKPFSFLTISVVEK